MGERQRELVRAENRFHLNCKAERITPKGEHGGKSQERNGVFDDVFIVFMFVTVLRLA